MCRRLLPSWGHIASWNRIPGPETMKQGFCQVVANFRGTSARQQGLLNSIKIMGKTEVLNPTFRERFGQGTMFHINRLCGVVLLPR